MHKRELNSIVFPKSIKPLIRISQGIFYLLPNLKNLLSAVSLGMSGFLSAAFSSINVVNHKDICGELHSFQYRCWLNIDPKKT